MKKLFALFLIIPSLLLAVGGTGGNEPSKEHSQTPSYNPPSQTPTGETIYITINFINGSRNVLEHQKGQVFRMEDHYDGFKAYTDDFYTVAYSPRKINEDTTLYAREDNGYNVFAIYDVIDGTPQLYSIGAYPAQSGLYGYSYEFQLYTNVGCTSAYPIDQEIAIPNAGLKLYRKYTARNYDLFPFTYSHYMDNVYDMEISDAGAVDYIMSGLAIMGGSGIPASEYETTTFQFEDSGQVIEKDKLYVFNKFNEVRINCFRHLNQYKAINVYDYDNGTLLGIVPWSIDSSFYKQVTGYSYRSVIEWDWDRGIARVSGVTKLLRCVFTLVNNGHAVKWYVNYASPSEGFNFEHVGDKEYYFDMELTRPIEHRVYNTDLNIYSQFQ